MHQLKWLPSNVAQRIKKQFQRIIIRSNQIHTRHCEHLWLVLQSNRPNNGTNSKLNCVAPNQSNTATEWGSIPLFGSLFNLSRCNSEIQGRWHDLSSLLRQIPYLRATAQNQSSWIFLPLQQIWQRHKQRCNCNTIKDNQTRHGLSRRNKVASVYYNYKKNSATSENNTRINQCSQPKTPTIIDN